MRVIEQEMNKAIREKRNWSKENTTVTINRTPKGDITEVRLFGHLIASYSLDILIINSCGFRTVTTKSRLNAILDELRNGWFIFQKKGIWYTQKNGVVYNFEDNMRVRK